MQIPVPEHWKKLWDVWDLRTFIILSLSLQTFLILFAPLRKRTANGWIMMSLWSAYLLADWAAIFAVGLISNNNQEGSGSVDNGDLLAFWAPFLLVHLGGPDTITAFALEDNELWLRHLFNLISQCLAAGYVLFQTLPKNKLWFPTILMFLSGTIKYAERTRSLYLASMNSFRGSMLKEADPGPNYAKLMDEYFSKKESNLPTRIVMLPEPDRITKAVNAVKKGNLTELEVVLHAYRFFDTFKGLLVDLIFSFRERKESRDFFLERSSKDAFRLVEVELNFIYEVLYTKVSVVHCKTGYIFRSISFGSLVVSLVLFYLVRKKKDFDPFDVRITYTLMFGAIALDLIAFLMLIFSDWTIIGLKKSPDNKSEDNSFSAKLLTFLLTVKRGKWFKNSKNPFFCCLGSPPQVLHRRWAESVSQYNFIYYCLHQRSKVEESIYGYLGLSGFLDSWKYVKNEKFTDELRDFIFEELLMKSKMADDLETAKEICSAKGDWILRVEGCGTLLPYTDEVDYDESLLLWHIATELCYNEDKHIATQNNTLEAFNDDKNRVFAKLLSDYMLYLLVMQTTMMSTVAGIGQIRFRDTSEEAIKFFPRAKSEKAQKRKTPDEEQIEACLRILGVNTAVKPVTIKGDRSKSVLFDACILAKELKSLEKSSEKKDKWVIMSRVWVELLSYAACHCRANTHAQQVSKGGELITLVWLLMAHFGLGEQFQISEGHARAKLIVGK